MSSDAPPEDRLATVERHVVAVEHRVTRMTALLEDLQGGNHPEEAALAKEALAVLEVSLGLLHDHLRLLRRSLP